MTDAPLVALVVDDEPANRAVLRGFLRNVCPVREAASGPEALAILEREPIDLVLLDVMMPVMNGIDVVKQIRATPREGLLPIILVTALDGQEHRNAGLQAGADDFLTKPVDKVELALRVRGWLKLKEQDTRIRAQMVELRTLQQAKDDLVSLLVHDMRSPLAGQVAILQLVLEDLADPAHARIRSDVEQALRAGNKVVDSLEEALKVRLIEEGHLPIRRERVGMDSLLGDAVETVVGVARKRHISLSSVVKATGLSALVDVKLVRRSVENLLTNALKYTQSGGDVVVAADRDGSSLEIEVADRGPGIPDELKSSMFGKFGSVEARKGKSRTGFGLGLYLVKLVAEGHGGAVSVKDRPGGGSIFQLRLADAAV